MEFISERNIQKTRKSIFIEGAMPEKALKYALFQKF